MRKNEYNSIEEFKSQFIGIWAPSEGHWFGLEFQYKNQEYRLHTGLMYGEEDIWDKNGAEKPFRLYLKTDMIDTSFPDAEIPKYKMLGEFATMDDLLACQIIDDRAFEEVIMDDETIILAKD